jgi:hypothetical protein
MAITNANILASATTVYTSTGNTVVSTLHLCNQSAAAVTVSVNLVPSGGTAAANNKIYANLSIAILDTYVIETERFILGNGDFISCTANTANSVIATTTYTGI